MRYPTGWRSFNHALFPPRFEVLGLGDRSRVLDPLDHLGHCNEIHVVVVLQNFIDPVQERVQIFGVVFQPGSVEVETKRSTVL